MDNKTIQAFEWAKSQNWPSVAARYAKTLAQYIEKTEKDSEIERELLYNYATGKNRSGDAIVDYVKKKLEEI